MLSIRGLLMEKRIAATVPRIGQINKQVLARLESKEGV